MYKGQRFFVCKHCGNLVGLILNKGVPLVCCGEEMAELIPNTVDASVEKHVPVVTVKDNIVSVDIGSTPHPMTQEHHIEWVYIETEKGGQRKSYFNDNIAHVEFSLVDDKVVAAFAFCNLHGLWKTEV